MGPTGVLHVLDVYRNLEAQYFAHIAARASDQFPPSFAALGETAPFQLNGWTRDRPVYPLSGGARTKLLTTVFPLVRSIRQSGASIVHAHFFFPTLVGLIASRLAGVPFVFTRHHSDHNSRLGKPIHVAIDRWCGRLSSRAIAVSRATRDCMVSEGIPENQIVVVHNGTDGLGEAPADASSSVRQEFSLPADSRIILVVARLHEEKGHATLFDAMEALGEPNVWALLAGEGTERANIEKHIASRGLRVRVLGRRSDIGRLMASADVLALPSRAESFGYVLVEAMGIGTPIAASRCGGVTEIVEDGRSGLLFDIDDAHGLARCLDQILKDSDLRLRLVAGGRQRAREFSFERMIRAYEDVYRKVVEP